VLVVAIGVGVAVADEAVVGTVLVDGDGEPASDAPAQAVTDRARAAAANKCSRVVFGMNPSRAGHD
jgi:hypothetical protein